VSYVREETSFLLNDILEDFFFMIWEVKCDENAELEQSEINFLFLNFTTIPEN